MYRHCLQRCQVRSDGIQLRADCINLLPAYPPAPYPPTPDTEVSNSCLTYGIIADKPCTVTEVPWEYSERRFNALVMTDDTLFNESFIMSKLYDTISAVELTVLLPATSRLSMLLMDA